MPTRSCRCANLAACPSFSDPQEVARLLTSTTNIKHKAALSLAYATGLRRSEVVSLRLTDIDSDRMLIRVEQGKGKKDRYVILSPHLLVLLREWWRVALTDCVGGGSPSPVWISAWDWCGNAGWREERVGHELSSPINGVGHCRGWEPGSKVSMMIIRPPQQGQAFHSGSS